MSVFVGKSALDFTTPAVMPDNSIEERFNFKSYLNNRKGVLLFYPLDFTFVCPSELLALNNRLAAFELRNTAVIAVSIDSHFCHLAWKNTSINEGGIGNVQYPMVSDINKEISRQYNVLTEAGVALRGTFIIDEEFVLRHMLVNDLPLGRNLDETIRTIDALKFYQGHGEVCPAGWKEGESGMKSTSEGVAEYLKKYAVKL